MLWDDLLPTVADSCSVLSTSVLVTEDEEDITICTWALMVAGHSWQPLPKLQGQELNEK